MTGTVTKQVDGLTCHCNPLPVYPVGARLLAELADVAAPALSVLVPSIEGSGADLEKPEGVAGLLAKLDAAQVFAAIGQAFGRLAGDNPARFTRVTGELLRGVSVELVEDGRVVMVDLTSEKAIARVVGYNYQRLVKLLWFALGANFGGFFAAASAGSPGAVAVGSFRAG